MKKVKYVGGFDVILPSIPASAKPGEVIDVPDDFYNVNFEPVIEPNSKNKKGDIA